MLVGTTETSPGYRVQGSKRAVIWWRGPKPRTEWHIMAGLRSLFCVRSPNTRSFSERPRRTRLMHGSERTSDQATVS